MCGIFFVSHNDHLLSDTVKEYFNKGKNRGPDNSKLISFNSTYLIKDYFS